MIALTRGLRRFHTLRTLALVASTLALSLTAHSDDTAKLALPAQKLTPEEVDGVNASAQGLAGKAGSGDWTSTKEWKSYQQDLDDKWSYLNRIRLNAMKTWGGTALGDLRGKTGTVYYPFSGPDALYVDVLFPDSKTVIMAGLEPVGTMPDLEIGEGRAAWALSR
jgi:hypothetical protein